MHEIFSGNLQYLGGNDLTHKLVASYRQCVVIIASITVQETNAMRFVLPHRFTTKSKRNRLTVTEW